MNVNVKNVDPAVLARLAEQAAAEGMSQQEWLRQILARTASRLSPAELAAQRDAMTPMSESDYAALVGKAAQRRTDAMDRLRASGGRR